MGTDQLRKPFLPREGEHTVGSRRRCGLWPRQDEARRDAAPPTAATKRSPLPRGFHRIIKHRNNRTTGHPTIGWRPRRRSALPVRFSSDHHSSDQPGNRTSDQGCARGALGESALPELCGRGGLCVRIPPPHGAALLSQTRRCRRGGDTENNPKTPCLLFSGFSVLGAAGRFFGKFQTSAYAARPPRSASRRVHWQG